jgi:hypothetical protein
MILIKTLIKEIIIKRWEDASLAKKLVGYQVPFITLREL